MEGRIDGARVEGAIADESSRDDGSCPANRPLTRLRSDDPLAGGCRRRGWGRAKAQCLGQAMRDEISTLPKPFGDDFPPQTGNRLQSAALEMMVVHRPRGLAPFQIRLSTKVIEGGRRVCKITKRRQ